MHRLWIITALALALVVPCAIAQRRGGGSFGGAHFSGGSHASFSHAPAMSHGSVFTTAPRSNGIHIVTAHGHGFYHHHRYYRYPRFYGYGYPFYGYYGYDPWLWGSASSYDSSDQYYQQNQQLSQQVNDLSNEIAQLREEQAARTYAPPDPQPRPQATSSSKSEPALATVLIFQDKHQEEIHNYAVVGRTLWVFSEERARKIPLAQLDVPATTKANDDRGVDFNVPR